MSDARGNDKRTGDLAAQGLLVHDVGLLVAQSQLSRSKVGLTGYLHRVSHVVSVHLNDVYVVRELWLSNVVDEVLSVYLDAARLRLKDPVFICSEEAILAL